MKRLPRLLTLALIASLLAAPTVFAQDKVTPPTPTTPAKPDKSPAAPPTPPKATDKPKADQPKLDQPKEEKPKADKPKTEGSSGDDKMKAYEEANKPGPHHKMLEQFEGEWAAEAKDLTPGEENIDKGTMTCKMMYGGRFLSMDYEGRNHGKFFRGGGMMGYNNLEKRFENAWADSMGTAITILLGSASSDGKVFTLSGDSVDPMTGKKATWKEVITITSKDTWRDDFYMVVGGKETKKMEITYSKAGKGEKKDESKKDDKPKGK